MISKFFNKINLSKFIIIRKVNLIYSYYLRLEFISCLLFSSFEKHASFFVVVFPIVRIVVRRLIENRLEDKSSTVTDLSPVRAVSLVSVPDQGDKFIGCVVNSTSIVEQVISQLVDITDSAHVVTKNLEVLEGAIPAREGYRVN